MDYCDIQEWLSNDPELLAQCEDLHKNCPQWFAIDPEKTKVYYRPPDEVKEIRKKPILQMGCSAKVKKHRFLKLTSRNE